MRMPQTPNLSPNLILKNRKWQKRPRTAGAFLFLPAPNRYFYAGSLHGFLCLFVATLLVVFVAASNRHCVAIDMVHDCHS